MKTWRGEYRSSRQVYYTLSSVISAFSKPPVIMKRLLLALTLGPLIYSALEQRGWASPDWMLPMKRTILNNISRCPSQRETSLIIETFYYTLTHNYSSIIMEKENLLAFFGMSR